MSQTAYDMLNIPVSPSPGISEFRLPSSGVPVSAEKRRSTEERKQREAAEERRQETIASWDEIAPTLSPSTLELAEEFVSVCEEKGAFYCDPGCHVDFIDDDQVMFDWNNGQLPIFTVLIGSDHPQVAFVGKFKKGEITGEVTNLEFLEDPLDRLVKEIGNRTWTPTSSPDSSTRIVNVALAPDELPSILLPPIEGSPSSPQTTPPNETSWRQGVMLRVRRTKSSSTGGLA